jgi:hypothetical protein
VVGKGAQASHVLAALARVQDLEAVQAESDERLDHRPRAVAPGMREHRDAAGGVHQVDGVGRVERLLSDERRPSVADVAVERLALLAHEARVHERARDVWPADRATAGVGEHRVHRHRRPELPKAGDHLLGATDAAGAKVRELGLERVGRLHVEGEQVDLTLHVKRAQLHAWHDAQAERGACGLRLGHAGHRVVVGERERGELRRARCGDHRSRRQRTVGGRGVGVQVDEAGARRDRGAGCGHRV